MNTNITEKALQGLELYYNGKYNEAEPLLREAANSGEINGIYGMGLIYLYRCNEIEGLKFLDRAISMRPHMTSTLAKLSCGEYFYSKGDFESQYRAVCYYESVLDEDEYPEMKQNASEMLKQIRIKMRSMYRENDSYFEELVLKGIDFLNNEIKSDALKILKMCVIMGAETSWLGMGLYYYQENKNDYALEFLRHYKRRSKGKKCMEEVCTLAAAIYEEKGDYISKKDSSYAQLMYTQAMQNVRTAISCANEPDSLNELKETHSRLMRKHALITADDMAEKKKQQDSIVSVEEITKIENDVLSQLVKIDQSGNEIPICDTRTQSRIKTNESAPAKKIRAVLPKTVAEYVKTFESRFKTDDSLCFPNGYKFRSDANYNSRMLKKINNAILKFAKNITRTDILAYFDLSLFGNGKNGFILTEDYVYYRYAGTTLKFDYSEIASINIEDGYNNWVNIYLKNQKYKDGYTFFSSKELEESKAIKELMTGCADIARNR